MIKKIELEMETLESWAKSCTTKKQLKTVVEFFELKMEQIPTMNKFTVSRNGLLSIGGAVGRTMGVLEYQIELIKKEEEKLAQ